MDKSASEFEFCRSNYSTKLILMKTNLLFLTYFLVSLSSMAQQTSYTTLVDDPYELNNLNVKLYLFNTDFYSGKKTAASDRVDASKTGLNTQVTLGVGFDLAADDLPFLNNKFGADLKYRQSYLEVYETYVEGSSVPLRNLEVGVSYSLLNKTVKRSRTLIVGQTMSTTSSISGVKMTQRNEFRPRLGFFNSRTPLSFDVGLQTIGSTVKTSGFYAGFEFVRTVNYSARVNGFSTARESHRMIFYADAMLASNVIFEDGFEGPKSTEAFDVKNYVDSLSLQQDVGLRAGLDYEMNPASLISFSFVGEIGVQPPVTGVHFYLGAAVAVNFSARRNSTKVMSD